MPETTAATTTSSSNGSGGGYEKGSALRNFKFLFGQQFLSRVMTFSMNLTVARRIGPALYGLASIHLYLCYTTILFLSREGVRRATMKFNPYQASHEELQRTVMAGGILAMIGSLVIAVLVGVGFCWYPPPEMMSTSAETWVYQQGVVLHCIAAVLEMMAEPLYVVAAKNLAGKLQMVVLSTAMGVKCFLLFALIHRQVFTGVDSLIAFGVAQCAFSIVVLCGYVGYFVRKNGGIHIMKCGTVYSTLMVIPQELRGMIKGFWWQSVEKLILTEGEKMVLISVDCNLDDQGVYAFVSNLGALVARFVFSPLEDTSFAEFSHLLRVQHVNKSTTSSNNNVSSRTRSKRKHSSKSSSTSSSAKSNAHSAETSDFRLRGVSQALHVLSVLVQFVIMLSLLFVVFGPNYADLLLRMLLGAERWSGTNAPDVLGVYCVYILFIAVNGLTESLLFALLTTKSLSSYNRILLLFSCGYVGACVLCLPRFGSIGLILANCFNMSMRITYSVWQIYAAVAREGVAGTGLLQTCLPTPQVLLMYGAASLATYASYTWIYAPVAAVATGWLNQSFVLAAAAHVGIGVIMLLVWAIVVWKKEAVFLGEFKQLWHSKRKRA